jgi:hypothetical protein
MTAKKITKLESEVLTIISFGDEYKGVPTESFSNIMDFFKGTKSELKAVLNSLIKKELVWLGEYPNGMNSYHLNK